MSAHRPLPSLCGMDTLLDAITAPGPHVAPAYFAPGVIRVCPSEREELIEALTQWNAAIAKATRQ